MVSDRKVTKARAKLRAGKGSKRSGNKKTKNDEQGDRQEDEHEDLLPPMIYGFPALELAQFFSSFVVAVASCLYCYRLIHWPIAYRPVDLSGKTFVVVGASAGSTSPPPSPPPLPLPCTPNLS